MIIYCLLIIIFFELLYHSLQRKFYAPPVPPLREGPYPVPKPYVPTIGTRDVAGDAIALPEFW